MLRGKGICLVYMYLNEGYESVLQISIRKAVFVLYSSSSIRQAV